LIFTNLNRAILTGANLSNADLRGVDLQSAQLTQADLSGAKLMAANLGQANLHKAKLLRANLSDAHLGHCILSEARLNRAYLSGADLTEANLCGADLSGANLLSTELSRANLRQVVMVRAFLNNANLQAADLSEADLNGTNLSRVNLQDAIVESTLFDGNLGLSEQQRFELQEQGAIFIPMPCLPSPPLTSDKQTEILRQIDEARGDLTHRFLDLEEAWQAFCESVDTLDNGLRNSSLDIDVAYLKEDCQRFNQEIEEHKAQALSSLENMAREDLEIWLSEELTNYLREIHQEVCWLSLYTHAIHSRWTDLSQQEQDSSALDKEDVEF
jgi:uncharacterized protein YjbI with pentapeptide repeats